MDNGKEKQVKEVYKALYCLTWPFILLWFCFACFELLTKAVAKHE